jgi:hypothetical protein
LARSSRTLQSSTASAAPGTLTLKAPLTPSTTQASKGRHVERELTRILMMENSQDIDSTDDKLHLWRALFSFLLRAVHT